MRTLPAVLFLGVGGMWLYSEAVAKPVAGPDRLEAAKQRAAELRRSLLVFGMGADGVPCGDLCAGSHYCHLCPNAVPLADAAGLIVTRQGLPIAANSVVVYVPDGAIVPGWADAELVRVAGSPDNVFQGSFLADLGDGIVEGVEESVRTSTRVLSVMAMVGLAAWAFWPEDAPKPAPSRRRLPVHG